MREAAATGRTGSVGRLPVGTTTRGHDRFVGWSLGTSDPRSGENYRKNESKQIGMEGFSNHGITDSGDQPAIRG